METLDEQARQELHRERDAHLATAESQIATFDKAVLAIAPSALALSISVAAGLARDGIPVSLGWSVTAFALFGAATLMVLGSCLNSGAADLRRVEVYGRILEGELPNNNEHLALRSWERHLGRLTWYAAAGVAAGVVCLVVFVTLALASR